MIKLKCIKESSCFYKGPFDLNGPIYGIGGDVKLNEVYYGAFYGENLINHKDLPEGYMYISCLDEKWPQSTRLMGLFPKENFIEINETR